MLQRFPILCKETRIIFRASISRHKHGGQLCSLIIFLSFWRGRFAIENGAPTRPSIFQPEHGESDSAKLFAQFVVVALCFRCDAMGQVNTFNMDMF